jgi:hypothetical protein
MIFAVEPLRDAWDEMVTLARQHWNETQAYRHNQPFNPSFDRYNQYAEAGWFLQFTARDEGRMVGYGGIYLVASMHTQILIAQEDTWYLLPEYRKGWNAVRFFRFMEDECRRRDAKQVNLSTPEGYASGIICQRLGYKKVANCWAKDIHPLEGESGSEDVQSSKSLVRADSPPLQRVELSNVPSHAASRRE